MCSPTSIGALLMTTSAHAQQSTQWKLVIHGGAGVIERSKMTADKDRAIRDALDKALVARSRIESPAQGGSLSMRSRRRSVLEDDPNFNAGKRRGVYRRRPKPTRRLDHGWGGPLQRARSQG